jgi:hypothetical protein
MPKSGLSASHQSPSFLPARAQSHPERRRSEQAITHWQETFAELGEIPSVETLGLVDIDTADWAHRFLILVDQNVIESSVILLHGHEFARLMDLPARKLPNVSLLKQLPRHYVEVFTAGCIDAHRHGEPVRREGDIERENGFRELYRASFIPVIVKESAETRLVFGAFNRVVID